jgi:hypothetical protein
MVYRGGCGSRFDDVCASPFSDDEWIEVGVTSIRGRSDEMMHFVGLDVSVQATSVCVVDDAGKVILEQKVPTEPAAIIALLTSLGVTFGRIGIEAGPLSQWLVNALTAVDLPVICVETRHMKALLTAQQINKTDRNDARGIAQMMRVGLFKPVHVKTLAAQEQRMLLTSRKLLQRKLLDVESDLRGTLRNFGLKVASSAALDTRCGSASSSKAFLGWPQSSGRCSPSAGSCANSSPSCTRCCSIWSAATRCADD